MEEIETLSRKDQIMKVSEKLFKEKSYMGTSMRDIAAVLEIEAASLYNHIKSKDQILEEICFRMAERFQTGIDEVNDLYFNAEEKLRMAIKSHVKILCSDLNASTVFLREWRHLNEPSHSKFIELRHRYQSSYNAILKNGEDEGTFETVDKKFAVLTILSAVNWIIEWYSPGGEMTPDEIADRLCDFILTGLKKKTIF